MNKSYYGQILDLTLFLLFLTVIFIFAGVMITLAIKENSLKEYIPQAEVKQKTVRVICEKEVVLNIATLTHEDPKYFYVEIMNERYKYPKNLCFHLDLKSPEYR